MPGAIPGLAPDILLTNFVSYNVSYSYIFTQLANSDVFNLPSNFITGTFSMFFFLLTLLDVLYSGLGLQIDAITIWNTMLGSNTYGRHYDL